MNIRGVFTEIPLFNDGEGNEDKATIYAGAPISEKDSVFNMGDIFEKYGNSTQAFISSYESYIQSFEKESKQASQMRETAINKMCNYLENSRGSAENFFGFFREMRGFIANEVVKTPFC